MLTHGVYQKQLLFRFVLMDSWYATKEIMLLIEDLKKIYYCPLKDNRQVDDSGAVLPYRRVDGLQWSDAEKEHGKIVKLKGFPKDHKVKLFRVVLSTQRTDYVAKPELSVTTLGVRSWCGSGSSKLPKKRNRRFIKSNMVCCPIIYVNS